MDKSSIVNAGVLGLITNIQGGCVEGIVLGSKKHFYTRAPESKLQEYRKYMLVMLY